MKIVTIFPKDSEALFNRNSERTFGGADVQMYLITKELAKGEDIDVVSFIVNYNIIDFDESNLFNLVKTYNESDNILKKILLYHYKIKKIKPDIIIQRGLTLFSCFLALYCRIFSIKYVFMFAHDIESRGRYQKNGKKCFSFKLLLDNAYRLVVQNEYEYQQLKEKTIISKLKILKKGIDFSKIVHGKRKVYDCIWIARCEPWKNPEVFIELARKNKNLKFVMVCSPVKGKEDFFKKIKSAAVNTGNIAFFEFLKNENIYNLLAQCKTFCITSKLEGDWPMAVLEAAASGLPILSLNLNYGELIKKYHGGFYCEKDVEQLHEKLNLLIQKRGLYTKTRQGAIAYIRDVHDIGNSLFADLFV